MLYLLIILCYILYRYIFIYIYYIPIVYNVFNPPVLIMLPLLQNWTDTRLTWSPEQYSDISSILRPRHLVWKPDIMLRNSLVKRHYCRSCTVNCKLY